MVIGKQDKLLLANILALCIIEIMCELTGGRLVPRYSFYCANPYMMFRIFRYILYYIITNPAAMILAIAEGFERRTVETVQSIPGAYPKDLIVALENGIHGTVGKTIAAVDALKRIGNVLLCQNRLRKKHQ